MVEDEEELIEDLRRSKEKIGALVPIFEDSQGEIIDGLHRARADENWPRVRLENVKTKMDRLILRLHLNVIRRNAPAREKTELLEEIGEILLEKGIPPGEISKKIAEYTGMSYQWVMKYLPDKYKDDAQAERASSALRRRAGITRWLKYLKPPAKKLLRVNSYKNSSRLHVIFEDSLSALAREGAKERLEKMNTTLDAFLQNIYEIHIRELNNLKPEEVEALAQALKQNKEPNKIKQRTIRTISNNSDVTV